MLKPPSMALRHELLWLAGTALAGVLFGALVGHVTLVLALALGLHAAWLLMRLEALGRWLQDGARLSEAPPTVGIGNGMVGVVHRMKKDSRKRKQRYRNAIAQFTDLARSLPDATVVLTAQREIRWANAAARTLLNVTYETDRGQRIDNLVRAPEFVKFLDGRIGTDDGIDQEVELELPLGSGRMLAIQVVPSGNAMSLLIARDVTQRAKVRNMRKRFVADVSHELRTPLTVIEGYLEMLREGGAPPAEPRFDRGTRDALDQMAEQSARMRHIVEHLLELSRLEGESLADDEGETVDVATMLSSVVAAVADAHPASAGTRFSVDADESLGLRGSERELWSACNNLVVNAAKYGGGGRVTVRWGRDADGKPTCTVEDDGDGIEARHLPHLSERFYRVDRNRSRASGGTGLGLAIVKHAAQRHGGRLDIRSAPGRGSTFTIEFPAERAVALAAPALR